MSAPKRMSLTKRQSELSNAQIAFIVQSQSRDFDKHQKSRGSFITETTGERKSRRWLTPVVEPDWVPAEELVEEPDPPQQARRSSGAARAPLGIPDVSEGAAFEEVYHYMPHPYRLMTNFNVCQPPEEKEGPDDEPVPDAQRQRLAVTVATRNDRDKQELADALDLMQMYKRQHIPGFAMFLKARRNKAGTHVHVVLSVAPQQADNDFFFGRGQNLDWPGGDEQRNLFSGKYVHQAAQLLQKVYVDRRLIIVDLVPGTFMLSGAVDDPNTYVILVYPRGAVKEANLATPEAARMRKEQLEQFALVIKAIRGGADVAQGSNWYPFVQHIRATGPTGCKNIMQLMYDGQNKYRVFPKEEFYPADPKVYQQIATNPKLVFNAGYDGDSRRRWGGEEREWSGRGRGRRHDSDSRRLAELQEENDELVAEHERLRGKLRRVCGLIHDARDRL